MSEGAQGKFVVTAHRPSQSPSYEATQTRMEHYSLSEVARLAGISQRRLRYWDRIGLIPSSGVSARKRLYSFRDLVAIRAVKKLLDEGISLQRIRNDLQTVRHQFPHLSTSLACLRMYSEHMRLLIREGSSVFDASTGQRLLNLVPSDHGEENLASVALLHPQGPQKDFLPEDEQKTAFEWFQLACFYEQKWNGEDPHDQAFIDACHAYDRALDLDPEFAAAYTNLGALLAAIGDLEGARDHFDHALRCDAEQTEAQANLAALALHSGDFETAIAGYRQVLRDVPDDFEAHYGLARAFLASGAKNKALVHLERFCRGVAGIMKEGGNFSLVKRYEYANQMLGRLRGEL